MKKMLLYYCYCYPLNYELIPEHIKYGYEMHFYLLDHYKDIFDKVKIILGIDNKNNPYEILKFYKEKFKEIFKDKDLEIVLVENNPIFRDAAVYKNIFIKNLEEYKDYLLFFSQSKGLGNINERADWVKDLIPLYEWIYALYYFNLENIKNIEDSLINKNICHGALYLDFLSEKNKLSAGDKLGYRFSKTKWLYSGSFQWININKLLNHISENSINLDRLPIMQRYFSEDFLGNIIPVEFAGGPKTKFYYDDYKNIDNHIKELYPEADYMEFLNNFNKFFNVIND